MAQPKTIGAEDIHAAIERLATAIVARHSNSKGLLILGIANGGIELARRLAERLTELKLGLTIKSGTVDISFHRDDISSNPIPKEFAPTRIPSDVNAATIILVDDVLHSGRTIKAALDELFDHGRPTKVELAILVDRGGRRLPVAADYCGLSVGATDGEKVIVHLNRERPSHDQIRVEPLAARNSSL